MSIEAIAAARRVQSDTVESYLAECITAGFGYDWQRMGVTDAMRDRIIFGLASLFKQHPLQVDSPTPFPPLFHRPSGVPPAIDPGSRKLL